MNDEYDAPEWGDEIFEGHEHVKPLSDLIQASDPDEARALVEELGSRLQPAAPAEDNSDDEDGVRVAVEDGDDFAKFFERAKAKGVRW